MPKGLQKRQDIQI